MSRRRSRGNSARSRQRRVPKTPKTRWIQLDGVVTISWASVEASKAWLPVMARRLTSVSPGPQVRSCARIGAAASDAAWIATTAGTTPVTRLNRATRVTRVTRRAARGGAARRPLRRSGVRSVGRSDSVDEDRPRALLLGPPLGIGGELAEMADRDPLVRAHEHDRGRHGGDREGPRQAVAIDPVERAPLERVAPDDAADHIPEPAAALAHHAGRAIERRHDQEIIAADVADEIRRVADRRHRFQHRGPGPTDHGIGGGEAERVGERLEVVDIEVADGERLLGADPPHDLFLDRPPAREPTRGGAVGLAT